MKTNLATELQAGIEALGLIVESKTQHQLLEFLEMLQKWNKAYNLTAITSLNKMLTHHLLDSLAVAPYLQGERILDVGSGAGFPGIPLAFCYPQKQFVLLDSNGKKTRFLQQVKAQFKLTHVEIIQQRVEKMTAAQAFDVIISRALGDISELIAASRDLLTARGHWLFMKGAFPQQEIEHLRHHFVTQRLEIPGVDAERHLIIVDAKNFADEKE